VLSFLVRTWRRFIGLLTIPVAWVRGWRRRRAERLALPAQPVLLPALCQEIVALAESAFPEFVSLDADLPRPRPGVFVFEKQDAEWLAGLAAEGRALGELGFGRLVFVHGSFVGRDVASMVSALKVLVPFLPQRLETSLLTLIKRQANTLLRDNGNFLPEYARLFARATDWGESVENFVWSSGNHHSARLMAALELGESLAKLPSVHASRDATLLLGHSHAGQVFALLTRLVQECRGKEEPLLSAEVRASPLAPLFHEDAFVALGKRRLEFVTLGAPARYRYFLSRRMGLHSIVNHRGTSFTGGTLAGFPFTRDGDYVQQWGLHGTDFFAFTAWERELNQRLDALLGPGQGIGAWRATSRLRKRVCDQGRTLLVDFGDASHRIPNFVGTVFGHGAYTRLTHMLPLTRLVRQRLEES